MMAVVIVLALLATIAGMVVEGENYGKRGKGRRKRR